MSDSLQIEQRQLESFLYEDVLQKALSEDLGLGDVTTDCLLSDACRGIGRIYAKESLVVAGIDVARRVFLTVSSDLVVTARASDGDQLSEGEVLMEIAGPVPPLLKAERVALNFLQHLSGVATMTRRFVNAISGTKARIVDTRKTLPGLRYLEKYAVRVGGGFNHRGSLSEGVLIKENHIEACRGIRPAVERARMCIPHLMRIEVEVRTIAEVKEALEAGAHCILLDNMTPEDIARAVTFIAGRVPVEASGRIDLNNVRTIAETGVDYISVGKITHSAPAVDVAMCITYGGS